MARIITRRAILSGFIAAPAIVSFANIMPVRGIVMPVIAPDLQFSPFEWGEFNWGTETGEPFVRIPGYSTTNLW